MTAASGEEQVLAALVTRLETITTANGYETEVASVQRYDETNDYLLGAPQIVMVQLDTDYDQTESYGEVRADMQVLLELRLGNYDPAERETQVNAFLADVQKCLAPLVGTALEDLVYDLRWSRAQRFLIGSDQAAAGATLAVTLFTRLDRDDPYSITTC